MTKIASGRGPAASAPTPAAARPLRASSPAFARSPASMARGRLAHPRIERAVGRAAERAARSAQAVACDVGAALPSFAAAPWVNADGATVNRAPAGSWSSHARSAVPERTDVPALARRHAGPWPRKMSATSSDGRDTYRASGRRLGLRQCDAIERAHDLLDGLGGDAGVERRGIKLGMAEQPRVIMRSF